MINCADHESRMSGIVMPVAVALVVLGVLAGCGSNRHEFKKPIDVDYDMENIPEPEEDRVSQYYDFVDRTFFKETARGLNVARHYRNITGRPTKAENVDAFGDVPNSSWFTNRNGRRRLTPEEMRKGPNRTDGPAGGVWTVVRGKTQGVTPGFTIKDSRGDRYIIKFDPPNNPEMSTSAEVISSKLFYAMGYNTAENTLVNFDAKRLAVDPEAKFVDQLGEKRRMTDEDLTFMLAKVAQRPDGKFRAVASRFLEGVPKGPYSYYGLRKDDPNDIIRHEHRRELRGLRIPAAWLQHNDVRRINSLDMYVTEDGRSFVKHYLIDFGATLGSASLFPNLPSEGHEYQFDIGEATKSLFTLGIYKRRWLDAPETVYPSIGYIESDLFDPANWKPNYPIPAFQNLTNIDAYWATRIVMSFSDEQIRAAVETGELSNKEAEEYLVNTLIERRDKIGRYWYRQVNPLDEFVMEGEMERRRLYFEDLAVNAGFADLSKTTYKFQLFHNHCDKAEAITDAREVEASVVSNSGVFVSSDLTDLAETSMSALSSTGECDRYFYFVLWTKREPSSSNWGKWVKVHLNYITPEQGFKIIGVEHQN